MGLENIKSARDVWQFVVELRDFKPRIWRRFQIRSESMVQDFCYCVMAMFNCQGSHLHQITATKNGSAVTFTSENDEDDDIISFADFLKESGYGEIERFKNVPKRQMMKNTRVCDIFQKEKDFAILEYDFGDGWEFKVMLEKTTVENKLSDEEYAIAINGKGYGIIEDCGGTGGLADIRQALLLGESTEYFDSTNEMDEWLSVVVPDLELLKEKGLDYFAIDDVNEQIEDLEYLRDFFSGALFE